MQDNSHAQKKLNGQSITRKYTSASNAELIGAGDMFCKQSYQPVMYLDERHTLTPSNANKPQLG